MLCFILWHKIAVTVTTVTKDSKWKNTVERARDHCGRRGVTWGALRPCLMVTAIMKSSTPLVVNSQLCGACNCRLFTKCTACGIVRRLAAGHLLVGGSDTAENKNDVNTLQSAWMNEAGFDSPLDTQWIISQKLQRAYRIPTNFIYFSTSSAFNRSLPKINSAEFCSVIYITLFVLMFLERFLFRLCACSCCYCG